MTFLYLATEDALSEAVGKKMIEAEIGNIAVQPLRRNGSGYLKSKMRDFAEISARNVVFLLTDLDNVNCAPQMKKDWFQAIVQPDKFLFRIAVRETESWLMADRAHFSDFLGVTQNLLPRDPETLADPKAALVNIARRSKREIRSDLVPGRGVRAKQGIGYNEVLCDFVEKIWDCRRASHNSDSLRRACQRLAEIAHHITN
ncbi:DUF4276 family protein [Rhizobium leguminosarum]|uniref:DUF4276 family protein n=1 Tax=Rhizobium leguminosarum TaxID=384 RepID=UPI0014415BD9|nr:DUF4276 family protein [Rhizobium leguminosarum]NKK76677.1 hypothetical protein [Rhizobium leguminosarum bv. viciae]